MLVHEQGLILRFLRQRPTAAFAEVLRACMPGASADLGKRVLSDLEWLGYVTIFSGVRGEPMAVQLTEKGRAQVRQAAASPKKVGGLAMP
jgi:hypothetical protein